jgi:hypothetical protein
VAHRWSKGLPTQYGDLVVGTWDASLHGVAISVKNAPGQVRYMRGMRYEGVVTVVTFDDTPRGTGAQGGPGCAQDDALAVEAPRPARQDGACC